jgi:hypothetical protein
MRTRITSPSTDGPIKVAKGVTIVGRAVPADPKSFNRPPII